MGGAQHLSFYGVLPDEFTESHTANFEPFDIKSRSNPLASYGSGSARNVSISVDIHEDYLAEFNGGSADIREYIAAIKSITYPEYQGTLVVPPKVLLRVGTFLKIQGYCTSCSITWKKPIRDGRFIFATVQFDISEALEQAYSASEVFSMEDLRRC